MLDPNLELWRNTSQSAGVHSKHPRDMRATLAWSDDLVRARILSGLRYPTSAIADVLCNEHHSCVTCAAAANTAACLLCSLTLMMRSAATAAPSPTVQVRWLHPLLTGA